VSGRGNPHLHSCPSAQTTSTARPHHAPSAPKVAAQWHTCVDVGTHAPPPPHPPAAQQKSHTMAPHPKADSHDLWRHFPSNHTMPHPPPESQPPQHRGGATAGARVQPQQPAACSTSPATWAPWSTRFPRPQTRHTRSPRPLPPRPSPPRPSMAGGMAVGPPSLEILASSPPWKFWAPESSSLNKGAQKTTKVLRMGP